MQRGCAAPHSSSFSPCSLIGPAAAAQFGPSGPLLTHADTRQDLEDVDIAAAARAAARAAEPRVAADAEGLPRDWTCSASTTDVADVDAALPQIHVVYAYATDQPNDFATWADRLQGNVSVVQRFLSAQSGGTKALRFDMRTDCADDAVDITTVQLPQPSSYYLDDFDRVRDDTWAYFGAHGGIGAPRDLMILADDLTAATTTGSASASSTTTTGPARATSTTSAACLGPVGPGELAGRLRGRRRDLVARGLPARDHAQPRRRAGELHARDALRPLLGRGRRHVLRRRLEHRDAELLPAAAAARSTRATTAARTTTTPPRRRPAATSRRTGTSTTAPSWPRARTSRRPAAGPAARRRRRP